ncbi:hypothetical protein [Nostoc sp. CHAB 5715]|uniref:hypothetical protein n=1 Tax=Nostoc sp. CHAB 5715 TaxID=2780400 RepID=UPI001E2B9AC3|nr:hypothetical protein [Nostoc sp. CHAB 5715]MCC5620677.1 hypothetical protein [Nostoc sp. CHAB 5715]
MAFLGDRRLRFRRTPCQWHRCQAAAPLGSRRGESRYWDLLDQSYNFDWVFSSENIWAIVYLLRTAIAFKNRLYLHYRLYLH